MRQTLYLDMDGVLADFGGALAERGVFDNQGEFHHLPKDQWTFPQKALDMQVRECMESPNFWPHIPLMEGAKALWQFGQSFKQVYVLTALPRDTQHAKRIEKQKREWIQRHFGPFPDDQIIVCQRAEKRTYAAQGAVLVDDMLVNCREWEGAGGIAIPFINAQDAIHQLILLNAKPAQVRCAECDGRPGVHVMGCKTAAGVAPLREKTSVERKVEPIHSGVMLYFPDALAAVARISKAGNDKHNPGEPLHWARGKSMDQMDASARHMLTLDKVDTESGELEAAHNAWRALAQLQLLEERRLCANGIRPYSGIAP